MRAQIQFENLLECLSHQKFLKESFPDLIEKLFEAVRQDIGMYRVGFWVFQSRKHAFENFISWDGSVCPKLPELSIETFPEFFQELHNRHHGSINALHINAFTHEFAGSFFEKDKVQALAWVHVILNGSLIGLVLLESRQHRVWKQLDTLYKLTLATHLSAAYMASLERKKDERKQASLLFDENPLPVLICDPKSKKIEAINAAAAAKYGFHDLNFKSLTFWDLGEVKEIEFEKNKEGCHFFKGVHNRKNGKTFPVKVVTFLSVHKGKPVWACMVIDSQEESKLSHANQALANKLTEHAFYTSHNIRGPLANILGLIELLPYVLEDKESHKEIIYRLKTQSLVLEETIRVMAAKVELD